MANVIAVSVLLFGSLAVRAATTGPPGCDYRGGHYQIGANFRPSPCEDCFCSRDGQAVCAVTDCPYLMCADAIHDPTQCCPVCPNGPTCSYNGTILKTGESVKPDAKTTCHCFAPLVHCSHVYTVTSHVYTVTTPRIHVDPPVG